MAPKKRIQISKDDQEQEDPPTASKKKERLLPRASKGKGISKAREDLPASSSAATTMKRAPCSHPSSSLGVCDVCEELLPEFYGMPSEYMLEGRTSTEDALWFWP